VPVLKHGVNMECIVNNVVRQDESAAITEEITDQFEVQMLVRCSKCTCDVKQYAVKQASKAEKIELNDADKKKMTELLNTLKERQKRTIQRKLDNEVLDYDPQQNVFVYKEDGALFKMGEENEDDDSGSD